jgi:hypothetical protein
MPKILIMNAGTEQMSGAHLTDVHRSLAAKSAWRSVWFAEEGDLIISPVSIQSELLAYLGETLKFDSSTISVIVPEILQTGAILSDVDLLSNRLIETIRVQVLEPSRWIIAPCYFTEGAANLAAALGISQPGHLNFSATCRRQGTAQAPMSRLRSPRSVQVRDRDGLAKERATPAEVRPPQLAASRFAKQWSLLVLP